MNGVVYLEAFKFASRRLPHRSQTRVQHEVKLLLGFMVVRMQCVQRDGL